MDWNWKDKDSAAQYNALFATPADEFRACAARLRIGPGDIVLDLGCGDGAFLAAAMEKAAGAVGVDISDAQLAAAAARFKNDPRVELRKTPFLEFNAPDDAFTRGFSRKALHHLDDGQKAAFFARAGRCFRRGALFLLEDGIFDFERESLEDNWDALIKDCERYYGAGWDKKKADVTFCFRKEFPAGIKAWTAAFEAGGFRVLVRERRSSFYGSLLAEKL